VVLFLTILPFYFSDCNLTHICHGVLALGLMAQLFSARERHVSRAQRERRGRVGRVDRVRRGQRRAVDVRDALSVWFILYIYILVFVYLNHSIISSLNMFLRCLDSADSLFSFFRCIPHPSRNSHLIR
jgi:hypothetical protein